MNDKERFNPATYLLIDRITGEEIDVDMFVKKASSNNWEKAYAKTIAEYIDCGGGKAVALLSYMLREKDGKNMILGTQRELSEKTGVSLSVVSSTLTKLQNKGLLKQVRSGCYMLSPKVIAHGSKISGVIMLRMWGE